MTAGEDIVEGIPFVLSNPAGATYTASGYAYDVAINGLPFFIAASDDNPYRRVTAQYRKQQIDQSREPGEQTLTGWWLRSQSSFHYGQGIKFFEPIQDESLRFQYTESKGMNVWTKGQATLLKDVDGGIHTTTGGINDNGRPDQIMRSIKWTKPTFTGATTVNTYNGVLMLDEYDVDKILPRITVSITNKARTTTVATLTTSAAHGLAVGMVITISGVGAPFDGDFTITTVPSATTFTYTTPTSGTIASTVVSPPGTGITDVTHFIDYNAGTDDPVFAICDDGTYAYWVTNKVSGGSSKIHVYKKLLSDDSSVAETLMFNATGVVVTNAVMEFTKERLVLAANNKVYEFATSATSLPSPVYTHPTDNFVYTSITSSGSAIYLAGYTNIQSTIQKFTLSTAGAMPTLTSAITAAELPVGERVFKISYYLGNMAIGTNQGMRMAQLSDTDGSITYGALLFESEQPVYDFAFRDRYIWAATGVEGQVGVTRIDMGQPLGNLQFPYAFDLYDPNDALGHYTTSCAFLGDTERLAFCNAGNGANGYVYIESATELIPSGYLRTGYVRYNTLELKIYKLLQPRVDTTNGGINVYSVDSEDTEYSLGTYSQGTSVGEININYPQAAQEYLGFKFVFSRSTTNSALGPLFTGYQIKALPAIPRQRLIQYPLFCFDHESDKFGNEVGYEGSAYSRLTSLESVENAGDTIQVQDFRTGEAYLGLIEEMDFINKTPEDKRFTGYGGYLVVTIRTV